MTEAGKGAALGRSFGPPAPTFQPPIGPSVAATACCTA
jgi:hypothetical protein